MPQHPAYTLQWYEEDQAYHVFTEQGNEALEALPESPAWQAWLHSISSFAFHGKTGSYTACKERKVRGEDYWYAYVRIKGKVTKRYLGLSTSLTLARLEQVAQELATSQQAERWHEETVLGSATPISLSCRGTPRTDSMKGTSRATAQSPPVPRIMTKVQAPRLRSALVSRLIQRLQEGMKELLYPDLSSCRVPQNHTPHCWLASNHTPTASFSVEPEDNDPVRFFTYFLAALQPLDRHLGTSVLPLLQSRQSIALETTLALLISELSTYEGPDFVLVLDDYHIIMTEPIHRALAPALSPRLLGPVH